MAMLHAVVSGKCVLLLIGGAHVAGQSKRPLIKMADSSVSACIEQSAVMRVLVNEGVKPADMYRRLQAEYGDETLSRSKTFEWCKRLKDGRTSVSDDPGLGGSQPTAVIHVNIQSVERLILNNRRINLVVRNCTRDESFCGNGGHNHSRTFAFLRFYKLFLSPGVTWNDPRIRRCGDARVLNPRRSMQFAARSSVCCCQ